MGERSFALTATNSILAISRRDNKFSRLKERLNDNLGGGLTARCIKTHAVEHRRVER